VSLLTRISNLRTDILTMNPVMQIISIGTIFNYK
jgi:hypothetical protein